MSSFLPTHNKTLNLFFNLLLLVMTIIVIGGLLEVYFRWTATSVRMIDKDWVRQYVEYNADGFRDKTYSTRKPENVFRILIIGDSQIFGHGIDRLDDTIPKRLEAYLNDGIRGFRFEVLNFAIPDWNTDAHVQNFFKKGLTYQPDLVLLVFYHNDIQASPLMKCNGMDIDFLPFKDDLKEFYNHFQLYKVLKFRINRLLEQVGEKLTYTHCRRQTFGSRAWNMESLYLDTLLYSAQKQNIHFMLAVLPVLFHLGKDYPLDFAHVQLAAYCANRNILCIDLFDEVFKGIEAKEVIISERDRHLNEMGTKLVAKKFLEHLTPLKNLRYLTRFEGAFSLKELLDDQGLIPILDTKFQELEMEGGFSRWTRNGMELNAWRDGDSFHFLKSTKNTITRKRLSLEETILDGHGRLIKRRINGYNADTGALINRSTIKFDGSQWIEARWSRPTSSSPGEFEGSRQIKYKFRYQSRFNRTLNRYFWNVAIEPDVLFADPLTLERALFDTRNEWEPVSKEELLKTLLFYHTYPFYQGKWSRKYATLLAMKIREKKPSMSAVEAAESFLNSSH